MKFDMYCDHIKVTTPHGETVSVSPAAYPHIFRLFNCWKEKLWNKVVAEYGNKFNDPNLNVFIVGDTDMYFTVELTDEDPIYSIGTRDKTRLFKMYDLYYKRQFSYSAFKTAIKNMSME